MNILDPISYRTLFYDFLPMNPPSTWEVHNGINKDERPHNMHILKITNLMVKLDWMSTSTHHPSPSSNNIHHIGYRST